MKIVKSSTVLLEDVKIQGAVGTKMRWLISTQDKTPNFVMRLFELEKRGNTPLHNHNWEHEVYVLEGNGALKVDEIEYPLSADDVVYVEPNLKHQFINKGKEKLKFLCLIPTSGVPGYTAGTPKKDKPKIKNPFANRKSVNNC